MNLKKDYCHNCGHKIPGLGCTKSGLQHAVKVTDWEQCDNWLPLDDLNTITGKEIQHSRRFDKDLPFGYIRLEYGEHNDTVERFKMMVGRNVG